MQQSLSRVGAPRYCTNLATRYNQLPPVTPVQTDLTDLTQYATSKAIDGLFTLVAQEEANIRENPVARTTGLLRPMFGRNNSWRLSAGVFASVCLRPSSTV